MSFISEHQEGCTPVNPCNTCQSVALLRAKLQPEDFRTWLRLLGEEDASPASRSAPVSGPIPVDTPLKNLSGFQALNVRVKNAVMNDRIVTVKDLLSRDRRELLRIPNFGRESLKELQGFVEEIGHQLGVIPIDS